MFLIERSVAPPRSRPRTAGMPRPGTHPLGTLADGAFELFPRHLFPGSGSLVAAALPLPFSAGRTWVDPSAPHTVATPPAPQLRRTA